MTLKYEFHKQKSSILIKDIDLNEKVVYNKFPFGKKYFDFFIGYKDNKEIRLLYIFSLEMSTCKRYSNNNKCMYFIIDIG